MKKYQEYRDSQHSWEKCIPNNWKCMKLQYCLSLLTDYTANGSFASLAKNVQYLDKPDYSRLVRLTDLRENLENDGIWITKDAHEFLEKSELFGGEIVLANVGAYTGLVCRIPPIKGKASLAPNMFLLKFKEILENNFMFYALLSYFCNEQLKLFATSTAQPKLNKDNTKAVRIFVPSKSEQQLISQYLDQKTQQIDILIEKKRKMIELLKEERAAIINQAVTKGINPDAEMKDSGIEWLGEVPKHWEVKKLKYSLKLITDKNVNGSLLKIGLENIESKTGKYIETDSEFLGEGIKFSKNDLLFGKLRPYLAKVLLSEFEGNAIGDIFVYRAKEQVIPKFAFYRLLSDAFIEVINGSTFGAKMPRASSEFIGELPFPYPSINEQNAIVKYIDERITSIEKTIKITEKEIALIEEYRTALINEAVTGKIKVTESV